jgi:hypothetical protein
MCTEYFYNLVKDLDYFGDLDADGRIISYYNKFWGELIAYFPLIRQGQHRKRGIQKFFVAAGTSLARCYLVAIGGYTDGPTDTRVQHFFRSCVNSLPREPSRCLAPKGRI